LDEIFLKAMEYCVKPNEKKTSTKKKKKNSIFLSISENDKEDKKD
jgi:hypothetical protein